MLVQDIFDAKSTDIRANVNYSVDATMIIQVKVGCLLQNMICICIHMTDM